MTSSVKPLAGPGRDADRVAEAGLAQPGHRLPDRRRRVADAVGVVQQQHVEVPDAAALEAALGGLAQVGGVLRRARGWR